MPQRIGDRVLLSTAEAADMSKMGRVHIARLLRAELIEGLKLGHDWLVFEDSLKAYLAQPRRTGPKPKDKDVQPTSNGADSSTVHKHHDDSHRDLESDKN